MKVLGVLKLVFRPSFQPSSCCKGGFLVSSLRNASVQNIKAMEDYEKHIYDDSKTVVSFFGARFSTASQAIAPKFAELAEIRDETFLSIDIDDCPRAAYHADVDSVPTVVVMKGDDAYRVKIAPEKGCDCKHLIERTHEALQNVPEQKVVSHRWWDQNVRVDNQNVHRIGWATK